MRFRSSGSIVVALIFLRGTLVAGQDPTQRDAGTHQSGFVNSRGARIHYIEWPNARPAIVLLPGYSLTAHVFDEVGAQLAADYRIVAITPRGFGESDAPDSSAYTVATLVSDLTAVLVSLRIDRAVLVGHSLSGSVIARFALQHPSRVERLIFLDAFPYFVAEGGDSVTALDPVVPPAFAGDTTYAAVAAYLARYRFVPWRSSFEADLRVKPLGPEGARRRALTATYIQDQWASPPDLSRLTVPSLQLCAVTSVASEYPWLSKTAAEYARAQRYVDQILQPFNKRLCEHFSRTVPHSRVMEVPGSHYLFFTHPEVTVRAIRQFLQ